MGLLDSTGFLGAASGVSQEYLKQSAEERANEFQAMRDKRLDEIRRGQIGFEAELRTEEAMRQEGVAAAAAETQREAEAAAAKTKREAEASEAQKQRDFDAEQARLERESKGPDTVTTAAGAATSYWNPDTKRWETVRDQPAKATAGSMDPEKTGFRLQGSQKPVSMKRLQEVWRDQNFIKETDDIGNTIYKIKEGGNNSFFNWMNKVVIPEDRIDLSGSTVLPRDPDIIFEAMKEQMGAGFNADRAIKRIQQDFPLWNPAGEAPAEQPQPAPAAPEAAPETAPTSTVMGQPDNVAGLLTQGAVGQPGSGQVTAPQTDVFSGPIERRIRELERELQALDGRTGRSAIAKRRAIERELDQQRRMLGGG